MAILDYRLDGSEYTVIGKGTWTPEEKILIIPDKVNGLPVTGMEEEALRDIEVDELHVPFEVISSDEGFQFINAKHIYFPNVINIKSETFLANPYVDYIHLGDKLKSIYRNAFSVNLIKLYCNFTKEYWDSIDISDYWAEGLSFDVQFTKGLKQPSFINYYDGTKFIKTKAQVFNGDGWKIVDANYHTTTDFIRVPINYEIYQSDKIK